MGGGGVQRIKKGKSREGPAARPAMKLSKTVLKTRVITQFRE